MDIFSISGTIAIKFSEAISSIEKVTESSKEAAEGLGDVDEKAKDSQKSVKGSGESAEEASEGYTVWKNTLANLVSNTITGLISKCTELAGKMAELTKSAVGNYAEYEQLVGGVETLFQDSSDTLIGYAENAYKTAGMSSNEYMDTATSFAASLIQGLGGDTEKAVELTDLAITDMADNANKMGTDIESIQTAYQGFAKQNYTMLDNLKLGYGGTQEEMIRLINDSGVLNEEISSLDDVTFDQMIEAIHAVQTDLGITGTTAAEAGSTISGSWGSVQSLFQNILTKVGGELAPTVMGFLQQLSEWMESMDWDAFAESIGDAFDTALEWVQGIDFTTFFNNAVAALMTFISGLGDFVTWIVNVISWCVQYKDVLATVAEVIAGVVAALGTFSIINTVVSLVQMAGTAFTALWGVLSANPVDAVISIITILVTTIITLWNTNEGFRNAVITIWSEIKDTITTVVEAVKTFLAAAWEAISTTAQTVWNGIGTFFSTVWNGILTIITTVATAIQTVLSTAWNVITTVITTVMNAIQTVISTIWNGILTVITTVVGTIQTFLSNAWETINSLVNTSLERLRTIISTVWNAITTAITTAVNAIQTVITTVWNTIKSTVTTVMNGVKTTVSTIWNGIKTTVSTVINGIKTAVSNGFNNVKTTASNIMNGIKTTFTNAWNGIKTTFTNAWNGIKTNVSTVINGVKTTISTGLNGAKTTVTTVLNGIKTKFSTIFESAKTTVSNAINKIKGFFNFNWSLPSLKMPHFTVSGKFSLNPLSVPHFGIEWYKKAMEDGMVMNDPTIFGFNAKTNELLAGGEAGSETVVGTDSLMQMIRTAAAESNERLLSVMQGILDILESYLPGAANLQIVLDDGTLVGAITPQMLRNVRQWMSQEQKNTDAWKGR